MNHGPNDNIIFDDAILEINEYTIKKGLQLLFQKEEIV